jgi:hypothetical protein
MSSTTAPGIKAAFPSGPIADESGNVTPVWRGYFQSLYIRTGAAPGTSSPDLSSSLAAESAARSSADAGLTNAISAERTARENADTAETNARTAADALLLPKAGGDLTGPLTGTTAQFVSYRSGTASGPTWTSGTGAPASTQPLGSLYSRTDGTVGATLYVSRGAGTWLPVAAV